MPDASVDSRTTLCAPWREIESNKKTRGPGVKDALVIKPHRKLPTKSVLEIKAIAQLFVNFSRNVI